MTPQSGSLQHDLRVVNQSPVMSALIAAKGIQQTGVYVVLALLSVDRHSNGSGKIDHGWMQPNGKLRDVFGLHFDAVVDFDCGIDQPGFDTARVETQGLLFEVFPSFLPTQGVDRSARLGRSRACRFRSHES